jgi:hypothetical protein
MGEALKLQGIVEDMTSEQYHNHRGTYSSSQLKTLLEDAESFHAKYIARTIEKETNPVFDIGTYFHTAVLEPHKLQLECAVFDGIRRGKAWDQFQIDNKGKAIITKSEHEQALGLVKAVNGSPIALGRLERGNPEISAFIDVRVCEGEIYSPDMQILGKWGWESSKGKKLNPDKLTIIPLKVRADLLGDDFILDLKSTTGNAKSEWTMRNAVSKYSYDLSAALYLDLFTIATGKVKSEFIWTFASKDHYNSRSYIASSENIQVGRAKWKKAVLTLAGCIQDNWVFQDYMGILNPNMYELEWTKPKGSELL